MTEAWLSPPNPSEISAPEIGDVLASIRRLIAQEGSGLDAGRAAARDREATGRGEGSLPAGSGTGRIRSAIERELSAIEHRGDRLVLGGDADAPALRPSPTTAFAAGWRAPAAPEPASLPISDAVPAGAVLEGPARMDRDPGAMADQGISAGRQQGHARPAEAAPTILHPGAPTRPETTVQEVDMMLVDIYCAERKAAPAQGTGGEAFDLFAADEMADDDQLAGGNALRNLVRDVICQELQGEMGERISRNLRRAIRQEVAAAIAAGLTPAS
ncbi:MAG: hypothetical protein ACK5LJ_12610 [Paracoccus sp. (in: a-proteobacteria)]